MKSGHVGDADMFDYDVSQMSSRVQIAVKNFKTKCEQP